MFLGNSSEAGEGITGEGTGADHLFVFSFNGQRLTLLQVRGSCVKSHGGNKNRENERVICVTYLENTTRSNLAKVNVRDGE